MSRFFPLFNETLTQSASYLEPVAPGINSHWGNPAPAASIIDRSVAPVFYWENDADCYDGNGKKNLNKIFKKIRFPQ